MSPPLLSVVIPTYNEGANVAPLLQAIRQALGSITYEAVVVDDDSKDDTAKLARSEGARVIVRKAERGLATAVVRGIREAKGEYVAVMDADFQHPPEVLARLLQKALDDEADVVVGSRYADGGSEGGFGPVRRVISWGAKTLGRLALPPIRKFRITDPMSGLFLVRRDAVDCDALRPSGYKILLEILGRCPLAKVSEVGYSFQDRRGGESKLGAGVMAQYVQHLAGLAWDHADNRRIVRFGLVGLSGVLVNLLLLYALHGRLGLHDLVAVPIAVEASILSNFLLNDRFTFHDRRDQAWLHRLLKFNTVSLLALAINVLAYALFERLLGLPYLVAEAAAIVVAFGANYAGNLHWTYGGDDRFRLTHSLRRLLPVVPIVALGIGAGFAYFDHVDRVHEIYFDEHYYVSVARQIDNGIWEDPCWTHDIRLNQRPLNFEHPPLAKLILGWSVSRFDTDHAIFRGGDPGPGVPHPGCRSPDNTETLTIPCQLVEHGTVLATYDTSKACYDAFTARAKTEANLYAWRGPSAVAGAVAVLFSGLAARRLFGATSAGVLASGLVLLDNLVYSSARIALLDIFPAAFTAMAVWAATFPTRKGVLGAALFLGLGFACKYPVAFAGPPVALLALWVHRRAGVLTRRRFDLMLASFLLLPPVVLLTTYTPWLRLWIPRMGLVDASKHLAHVLGAALKYGSQGGDTWNPHSYHTPPAHWFAMAKPTFYYHIWGFDDGKEGWVYALGNPVLWWLAALAALGALAVVLVRYALRLRSGWVGPLAFFRDEPRPLQALAMATFLPLVTYAGFFLVQGRDTFLFYMTLVVPLLALPLAGALSVAWRRGGWAGRVAVGLAVALVAATFAWYYPVVSAWRITPEMHERIMGLLPWMGYPS